jgi:hypothetical protein
MESTTRLSRDEYIDLMRKVMEEALGKVADAINEAPPGHVISASEEKVRDLFGDLRRRAYERGVQMRLDAAEAAFPPSKGPGHRPGQAQQGAAGLHRSAREVDQAKRRTPRDAGTRGGARGEGEARQCETRPGQDRHVSHRHRGNPPLAPGP